MKLLITGIAGFIGYNLADTLARQNPNMQIVGIDNLNDYYDVTLKYARLKNLEIYKNIHFLQIDLNNDADISALFAEHKFDMVVNLAAQAGVRYSLQNPKAYIDANISGFLNILEGCRYNGVKHLLYASTSSVYGLNRQMPFSPHHPTEHPVSLYAATKKANEMMAHSYSHLFNIPTTGLRFFTVYGPWGRPDMALFLFAKAMLDNKPIDIFNHGNMVRDFTYIDDIVSGIIAALNNPPKQNIEWDGMDSATSSAPYRIYNIGNNKPVKLLDYVKALEDALGITAQKNFLDMQAGDVEGTWADVSDLQNDCGYMPTTSVQDGVKKFADWYKQYYGEKR